MNGMIARDVMSDHVMTVQADWPVSRLAEFFVEEGISGAPVLSDDGLLIGVVSVTDIVRHDSLHQREPHTNHVHEYYQLAREHRYAREDVRAFHIEDASEVIVADIMTPTIFKVQPNTPVKELAEMMVKGRIHRVLVVQADQVIGIVTALDILRFCPD